MPAPVLSALMGFTNTSGSPGYGARRPIPVLSAPLLGVSAVHSTGKAKDMHRMPPTTEPLGRNFLDETVFWIIAAEQEREAMRTHTSPATRDGRRSNTQFRARGFAESMHHPLIRIVSLQTG
jgi:hypothetical protein